MEFAIQIFQIVFYSVAILFMVTLTILSIWGFVIFNKIYKNQRINNFLLDKINQSISNIYCSNHPSASKEKFNIDEVIDENELFNSNDSDNDIISF